MRLILICLVCVFVLVFAVSCTSTPCERCGGTGLIHDGHSTYPCPVCRGTGEVSTEDSWNK